MRVTINDIARMSNVSKTTVSRVINNKSYGVSKETKDRILKLVAELNYQPSMIARSLVTKKTKTIGLIIPDITNPFFPQLVRGAEDYANEYGYQLFLSNSDNSSTKEAKYISVFIEKGVDGVILTPCVEAPDTQYDMLKDNHVRCVLVDRYIEIKDYEAGVYVANTKGAYLATKLLIEHGNKDIAFINGPAPLTTSQDRQRGFKKAFEEAGMEADKALIFEGDYLISSGVDITERLVRSGKHFTAILCGNDMMAIGAIRALKKNHIKIPQEVEVIGYDNIEMSDVIEPALSTVSQPSYEMGYQAAKMLIKLIEGKKLKKKEIVLEPELVLRSTTRMND